MRTILLIAGCASVAGISSNLAYGQESARIAAAAMPKAAERYDVSIPKPTVEGMKYGEHPRQVIDFWKAESTQQTPLVLVIHGGGWQGGSKERLHRFVDAPALLSEGISVAACNYRLIKHALSEKVDPPVKAPLHDAARALQYLRSKADELNIDIERIGAAGGSAGACTSLWLAFHDDLADANSNVPVARQSTRLYCAAVTGAQTTLDPVQMKEWTPNSRYGGHAFGFGSFSKFHTGREDVLPLIEEYSPYALVSKEDPAVYLTYSQAPALGQPQKDPTHTSNFGVKLQEHCRELGVQCELVYPGAKNIRNRTPTDFLIKTLKQ